MDQAATLYSSHSVNKTHQRLVATLEEERGRWVDREKFTWLFTYFSFDETQVLVAFSPNTNVASVWMWKRCVESLVKPSKPMISEEMHHFLFYTNTVSARDRNTSTKLWSMVAAHHWSAAGRSGFNGSWSGLCRYGAQNAMETWRFNEDSCLS